MTWVLVYLSYWRSNITYCIAYGFSYNIRSTFLYRVFCNYYHYSWMLVRGFIQGIKFKHSKEWAETLSKNILLRPRSAIYNTWYTKASNFINNYVNSHAFIYNFSLYFISKYVGLGISSIDVFLEAQHKTVWSNIISNKLSGKIIIYI